MKLNYKILIILFLFSLIGIAASQELQRVFILYIVVYRNDTVELKDFVIEEGILSDFLRIKPEYSIRIVSFDGNVIFQEYLDIGFTAYPFIEGGQETEILLDKRTLLLRLPFSPHAEKIELSHNDKIIFELDVKDYLCNRDVVCSGYEDEINCPEDCIPTTIPPTKPGRVNIFTVLLIVGIGMIIVIYLWKIRKTKSDFEKLKEKYGYRIFCCLACSSCLLCNSIFNSRFHSICWHGNSILLNRNV